MDSRYSLVSEILAVNPHQRIISVSAYDSHSCRVIRRISATTYCTCGKMCELVLAKSAEDVNFIADIFLK
jgi:hypothetical protein